MQVRAPAASCGDAHEAFGSLEALFDEARLQTPLAQHYRDAISKLTDEHEQGGARLGACLIEPVMQGAGGMIFVDPLFQRVLLRVRPSLTLATSFPPLRGLLAPHCAR